MNDPAAVDGPTVDNIGEWAATDRKRKVAIIGRTAPQARAWARNHGIAPIQMMIVEGAQTLFGMQGDDCAIVILKGVKMKQALQQRVSVCATNEVWVMRDDADTDAADTPMLGGISIGFGSSVTPRDHVEGQADVFLIVGPNAAAVSITRGQAPELIELVQAWMEARPWKDPAAARAEQIRAAVLAGKDPFAVPTSPEQLQRNG